MVKMLRGVVTILVLIVAVSACGGSSAPTATPDPSPTATDRPSSSVTVTSEPLAGQIAYVGIDGGLWIMDAEGHGANKIYATNEARITRPEWSPTGDRLAFTVTTFVVNPGPTESAYPDFTSVVVVDLSGDEVARIPRATFAHWAPDGTRLATLQEFGLYDESSYGGIPSVVNLSDQSVRQLTARVDTFDAPRWSPSGDWLAYATVTDGVFVLPGDGIGEPRRILAGGQSAYHNALIWADDRTVVVLEKRDGDFSPSYVFVDVDAGEQVRIPNQKATACGRETAPGDHQSISFGEGQFLAWPMQCQAPSGFWLAEVTRPESPRFFQVRDNGNIIVLSASPDGRHVLYSAAGGAQPVHRQSPTVAPARTPTGPLIWMVDLEAGQGTSVLLGPSGTQAVWSPR